MADDKKKKKKSRGLAGDAENIGKDVAAKILDPFGVGHAAEEFKNKKRGVLGDITAAGEDVGSAFVDPLGLGKDAINAIFGGGGGDKKKKPPPKKPPAATTTPETVAQYEAQIEKNDPFYAIGQALTNEEAQINKPVEQAISGQDTAAAEQSATSQAIADAGVSPGSSAAQWLQSNISQANANDAPMAQAMAAYGKAYGAGQQGIATALTGVNQANALGIATAPEQTWLQDLATHIQSNLAYPGTVPEWVQNLPPSVKQALQQSGQVGGSGTVPVTSLNYPGKPASNAPAAPGTSTSTEGAAPTLGGSGAAASQG